MTNSNAAVATAIETVNSLGGLCETLNNQNVFGGVGAQLSQTDTLWLNNRWYLISNFRNLLSQMYVEHGIVQTLVDQPVDDAFRAGFEIKTNQLSPDEVEELMIYCERNQVIANIMQGIKWGRLFGGGGILILVSDQDPAQPLDISKIGPDTQIEFRAIDMWELYFGLQNTVANLNVGGSMGSNLADQYDYYGLPVHVSRVYRIEGKQAPSFIRPRLRGWGMSELERLVRSLNQYMKNQDVIFQLLDEAKVDVYRIKGLNSALMTSAGTANVAKRIQAANQIKNYNNALTMDVGDEYEQKQMTFTGLAEMLTQIRQGVAADLKMPVTKLFGISAAGFNSGEDDIENYNSMIEGEIRNKNKFMVVDILQICCQKLFGTVIDDLQISFNPLRILNAKEEEEVKDSQFARVMEVYSSGLIQDDETKELINKDSLLPAEIDAARPAAMPLPDPSDKADNVKGVQAKGGVGKQTPSEA